MFSDNMPGFEYDHRQDAVDNLEKAKKFEELYKQEVLKNQLLVKEMDSLTEKYVNQEKAIAKLEREIHYFVK